jgi:hypothetical protein
MAAVLCLLYAATIMVDRSLNKERHGLALFAGIFLYNGAFQYGFASYIVGLAFAVLLFACWLRLRDWQSPLRYAVFTALAFGVFVFHFFAFALYALFLGGFEFSAFIARLRARRRFEASAVIELGAAAITVLAPACFLVLTRSGGDAGVIKWSTLQWKLEALTAPILFSMPWIELPLLVALGIALLFCLAKRIISIHPYMILPLGMAAVLALVMPRILLGSNYADYRFLPGVSFFFIASLRWAEPTSLGKKILTGFLALCLVVRVASIFAAWLPAQPILDEADRVMSSLPKGARVLSIEGPARSTSESRRPSLEHVPVYAAAKREGFVPTIFTPTSYPLRLTPEFAGYGNNGRFFAPYPEFARYMDEFDYVVTMRNPQFEVPAGLTLVEVAREPHFALFRIERK